MSLDISKLEKVKERGGKVTARCPACAEAGSDTSGDHLSIDAEGRFACVMFPAAEGKDHRRRIAQLAGKPDNFLLPRHDHARGHDSLTAAIASEARRLNRTTAAVYDYGETFAVARFEAEGTGKTFRPFCRNGSGWTAKDPAGPLPLYRLAELPTDPSARVYVTEGEKAADALATIGVMATTSAHGAKSPGKSDWTPLAGRDVVILPDNDEEGRKYAEAVAGILGRLNPPATVRIVELPDRPPKGDAVEWLDAREAQTPEDCRAELNRLTAIAPAKVETPAPTIRERLAERKFDPANPPPHEPVVFSINGTPIAHAGNITTIEAAQKSGKSAISAAAIASSFSREQSDCLGWESLNPQGRAVLAFDTEQSRGDHHRLMTRALAMAGTTEPPPWLESYCITGFSCAEMREAMLAAIADAEVKFGGVHSLFLDGVADPVSDVNDPEESFAFVAWLQASAIKGGFPVIGILHLNPNGEKSRGHLGSQLNRKSEHVLRLTKDGETTTVSSQ